MNIRDFVRSIQTARHPLRYGCGAHETVIGYQMRVYGQTFIEVVKALAWQASVDLADYVGRLEKPKAAPKSKNRQSGR